MRRLTLLVLVLLFGYGVTPARSQTSTFRITSIDWMGDRIAYGTSDGRVVIMDSNTGETIHNYPLATAAPTRSIFVDAWHPTGKYLAASTMFSAMIFILDVDTGEIIIELEPENVISVVRAVWSPDGTQLAVTSYCDNTCWDIRVWDWATGTTIKTILHADDLIGAPALFPLAWSPDGTRLGVIQYDGRFLILDTTTWEGLINLGGYNTTLTAAWLPDSERLAIAIMLSGSSQGRIFIVDVDSGDTLSTNPLTLAAFDRVIWSPDASRFVRIGWNAFEIWDTETGDKIAEFDLGDTIPDEISWSPDSSRLVYTDRDHIDFLDLSAP